LIASRRERPGDDPIFSLHKEATLRKQRGESIVDATIGVLLDDDGALAILPSAARAVREVPPIEWATYAPIAGTPDFLQAVIDDLLAGEPELARSAVAVATPGGSGAIRHAVTNFLEPGQALLTTDWFWGPYSTLCQEADRKLDTFEMFDSQGRFNVSALDSAIARHLAEQGRALIVLNDPAHNPTGYSMTDEEWRDVAECVAARAAAGPVVLLVDCAYFLYGARDLRDRLRHLKRLRGAAALLFAWSASKSFTHYGLRVGALVACIEDAPQREAVASALSFSCRGTWSNCNRGGLTAITRLLVDPALAAACDRERRELKELLSARVAAFNTHARLQNLRYPRYDGGFFVTVFAEKAPEKARLMATHGVYVVPLAGGLRVALCAVPERDVARLVGALAA
jgi:aromatic-amino-acid transaminase